MSEVVINADGACSGNPGPGGYGVWWEHNGERVEHFGGALTTTNNRMELRAAIVGLISMARLPPGQAPTSILIRSDSQYVVKGISQWIDGWKKKQWKDVKNVDLWQVLDQARQNLPVRFEWVRGHNGDHGNEHADQLARRGLAEAVSANKTVALVEKTPLASSKGMRP